MFGYALFLVPMTIAFVWVSVTRSLKQALLDLIAFNLLFNFDFSALLPNNTNLLLLHILLIAFVWVEILEFSLSNSFYLSRRAIITFFLIIVLMIWLSVAIFVNKAGDWGVRWVFSYILRVYLLNTLFIIVGIRLAKSDKLERFGKIFMISGALVGMICVLQTISGGALLTSDRSDRYLGVFQPLGDRAIMQRDIAQSLINYLDVVQTIRFGGLSFYRASGTFSGTYVSLCLVALISFYFLISRGKKNPSWLFAPLFLAAAGFVAALNRTVIATFIILASWVILTHLRTLLSLRVILRWFIPILIAGLIAFIYYKPLSSIVAANIDGFFGNRAAREISSLNGRSSLWAYIFSEVKRSPIVGSAAPITVYRAGWGPDDNPEVDLTAHNSFLELAYRGGVVPAILFILLFCLCLLRSWRLSRSRLLSSHQRLVFSVLLIAAVALGLLNMTASMITIPQSAALFWILCGYLASYTLSPKHMFEPRSHAHGSLASQTLA